MGSVQGRRYAQCLWAYVWLSLGSEKVRQEESRNTVSITASRIISLDMVRSLHECGDHYYL